MSDFDFEDLEVEVSSQRWFRESFPIEGQMKLLLDADYIAYTVGYCSSQEEYDKYLNGDFNIKAKYDHACFLILDAMRKAKADCVSLFTTDSATNFRVNLVEDYKAQRTTEKPPFWQEVKEWVNQLNCVVPSCENEADDMVSIVANEHYKELDADGVPRTKDAYSIWSKVIIGSKDKDVDHVFGNHVNLDTGEHYFVDVLGELHPKYGLKEINDYAYRPTYKGEPMPEGYEGPVDVFTRGANKGQVKTKRVLLGKKQVERMKALKGVGGKFFYAQMLMGDPTDNYFGIPNFGITSAFEALDKCTSIDGCHKVAYGLYEKHFGEDALSQWLLNGRLAWMQRYRGEVWNGEVFY